MFMSATMRSKNHQKSKSHLLVDRNGDLTKAIYHPTIYIRPYDDELQTSARTSNELVDDMQSPCRSMSCPVIPQQRIIRDLAGEVVSGLTPRLALELRKCRPTP